MDLRKVKKLIELLEESGLSEIEITEGDDKVRITKSSEEKQTTVVHTSNESKTKTNQIEDTKSINNTGFHEVKAPMIGTFYQSPEPDAESYVKVGDPISEGDTLCIIEAMKMMNKIESDISGIVERVLVQNGDPVEFDQVLFLVSKN